MWGSFQNADFPDADDVAVFHVQRKYQLCRTRPLLTDAVVHIGDTRRVRDIVRIRLWLRTGNAQCFRRINEFCRDALHGLQEHLPRMGVGFHVVDIQQRRIPIVKIQFRHVVPVIARRKRRIGPSDADLICAVFIGIDRFRSSVVVDLRASVPPAKQGQQDKHRQHPHAQPYAPWDPPECWNCCTDIDAFRAIGTKGCFLRQRRAAIRTSFHITTPPSNAIHFDSAFWD